MLDKTKTYLTVLFYDGEYITTDVTTYVRFHRMRLDEPVDWEQFLVEEHEINMEEVAGYFISKESFETILNLINQ